MMMKIINNILLICTLFVVCSCNDFLSTEPDKNTSVVPSEIEDLESLLNNYTVLSPEKNRTLVCSTDDYDILKELYLAKNNLYRMQTIQFATWDIDLVKYDADETFWQGEYNKIFIANMILYYLPRVNGDDASKSRLAGEAYFLRAYSMWVLAQTYCLPYTDQNKGELGLVLKESIDFEEDVTRKTLQETYVFIEKDMNEALRIMAENPTYSKNKSWRAGKASVNAFAARYYLNRNDYDRAIKYAEIALKEHSELVDYNLEMRYSDIYSYKVVNGEKVQILYPYTHDKRFYQPTDMMAWKELYFYRFLVDESWWMTPSKELLECYDKEYDLRYRYHMVKNYSYEMGVIDPPYEYPGYIFFDSDRVPSGPTVAEMILIKAEVLARQGNYTDAMIVVNKLRDKRMDLRAPQDRKYLAATNKDEAIREILQERRRELPFSQRWYDLRRYNNNDYPGDDVDVIKRSFFAYNEVSILGDTPKEYSLEKGSRRYAAPIPQEDVNSMGNIQQNKY